MEYLAKYFTVKTWVFKRALVGNSLNYISWDYFAVM